MSANELDRVRICAACDRAPPPDWRDVLTGLLAHIDQQEAEASRTAEQIEDLEERVEELKEELAGDDEAEHPAPTLLVPTV